MSSNWTPQFVCTVFLPTSTKSEGQPDIPPNFQAGVFTAQSSEQAKNGGTVGIVCAVQDVFKPVNRTATSSRIACLLGGWPIFAFVGKCGAVWNLTHSSLLLKPNSPTLAPPAAPQMWATPAYKLTGTALQYELPHEGYFSRLKRGFLWYSRPTLAHGTRRSPSK